MRYVLIPLSLIGFAYGMMHDFVWLELLTGGYLTSAVLLGSSDENQGDTIIWDWFDDNDNSSFWDNNSFFDFGNDDF
jgi:ABC-type spermidine/putrescine transport system permease subunit I